MNRLHLDLDPVLAPVLGVVEQFHLETAAGADRFAHHVAGGLVGAGALQELRWPATLDLGRRIPGKAGEAVVDPFDVSTGIRDHDGVVGAVGDHGQHAGFRFANCEGAAFFLLAFAGRIKPCAMRDQAVGHASECAAQGDQFVARGRQVSCVGIMAAGDGFGAPAQACKGAGDREGGKDAKCQCKGQYHGRHQQHMVAGFSANGRHRRAAEFRYQDQPGATRVEGNVTGVLSIGGSRVHRRNLCCQHAGDFRRIKADRIGVGGCRQYAVMRDQRDARRGRGCQESGELVVPSATKAERANDPAVQVDWQPVAHHQAAITFLELKYMASIECTGTARCILAGLAENRYAAHVHGIH